MAKRIDLVAALAAVTLLFAPSGGRAADGRFLGSEFLPIGSRYLGMGGGHVALPSGATGAYYNPALLPWADDLEFNIEGSFTSGPTLETDDGDNHLLYHDRGNFSLVAIRFPDAGGFSFGLLEATRYDHDLQGYLFGPPPGGGSKPVPDGAFSGGAAAAGTSDQQIRDYQDRVTLNSFGGAVGYKSSPNTSFGFAFWVDRKKVFKSLDYVTACTDITDEQFNNGWYDAEGTTNDVAVRFSAGLYRRLSDKIDGAIALNTGSDLKSVDQVDEWTTCAPAERRPTVNDETPLTAQAGLSYYWARSLRFALDATYQHWGGVPGDYESVVQFGVGAEWDPSERLVLRGGFYTSIDPSTAPDVGYAEALRDITRSGTLQSADEYFLTFGAGWWLTPYIMVDGAVANSDLLSPNDGRTTVLFSFRFILEAMAAGS